MEIYFQVHRPCCSSDGTRLKTRPFFGSFFPHSSHRCKETRGIRLSTSILASGDYSRRRSRKSQISRTKGPASKAYVPKPQFRTDDQKTDQSHNEKEVAGPSTSSEYTGASNMTETEIDEDELRRSKIAAESSEETMRTKILKEAEDIEVAATEVKIGKSLQRDDLPVVKADETDERGSMAEGDKNVVESGKPEVLDGGGMVLGREPVEMGDSKEEKGTMEDTVEDITELRKSKRPVKGNTLAEKELLVVSDFIEEKHSIENDEAIAEFEEPEVLGKDDMVDERPVTKSKDIVQVEADDDLAELGEQGLLATADTVVGKEPDMDEAMVKQKLEMEKFARKQLLEVLAKENLSKGSKMFVYPLVVKADQDIEVFLNRSMSTLKNEPEVYIMGAFNGWKWKFFTTKLQKTDLKGDWWSCQVHIPREAYKMDFVFFNGHEVYENNNTRDFFVPVEGGMDAISFEDFLLEEKRKELERLAAEQAERDRQAEEQRQLEAEKAAMEADKAQAKAETEKRREMVRQLMLKAVRFVDNVWHIEPSEFGGEDMVRLYYNRISGPLVHAQEVWIHGGYNNWKDGLSIVGRLVRSEKEAGDWWYVDVVVPDRALILDWVFADGPPGAAKAYDNNQRQDFHATVPKCMPEELYWLEEEQQFFRKLHKERRLREEAIRAKAEKTARMKAETKKRTMKIFLLSQKHIVYTEPLDVRAGSTVTVYYNPSNTVLSGKPEVWFRCSFNRWTHRLGLLPPQKMLPAENGSHVKVTVKVPLDAYIMDFVFSEKEDGGIYDNKNGMDYHIPVIGGVTKEPPMDIVQIAVEMAPIAKVGGLGDVVTSLSRAVQDLGHNVDVILPKYDCLNLSNVKDFQFHRSYSWGGTEIKVWHGKVEGLSVYFLEPQNGLFSVGCVYGRSNDGERFGFFCHAALEFLLQSGFHPDILHCHDWSSAPVAWLFKDHYMHYGLTNARVVFTIHNLEFGTPLIGKAVAYTDKATTVSPNYAKEVSGNPAVAPHLYKFHGILNGIDPDIWDPYNDKFIPVSYTPENVVEGKRAAKEALQQRLGLRRSDYPLVGIITRLTFQKGIHLIKHAISRTLERNGQVVLLGSAPDPRIQNDFVNLANQLHSSHGDRARLWLTYDEPLSHLIYAGSDFILVPSIFEPCGLTQLTAMRYGSIPVVRKTGGLYDTVFDVDHDKERAEAMGLEPNGFSFDGADAAGVDYALNRAISAWYEGRDWFNSLCKRVMEQDWSWNRPALDYMELYYAARK